MAHDDFDPLNRELCPDGTCIGLVGPNGRCKECGKPGTSSVTHPRERHLRSDEEVAAQLDANIQTGDIDAAPADLDRRRLCPDGSCIGVIGPDGRCTECGIEAEAEADSDPEADPDSDSDPDSDPDPDSDSEADPDPEAETEGDLEIDGDLEDRQLCPDGACIGLIGPDNRCKECGRPGTGITAG
jgi:hypothetical protein